MKRALGMVFAMVMMGTLLAACYPHCEQPVTAVQPMNMKGEG